MTNIDSCKDYFSQLILNEPLDTKPNTNELDKCCAALLSVLFEADKTKEDEFNSLKRQ